MNLPVLPCESFTLRLLQPQEAATAVKYYRSNQLHLNKWEPKRPSGFYQLSYWQQLLQQRLRQFQRGESVHLCAIDNRSKMMIGSCNFTQIDRQLNRNCFMGYSLDQYQQGQGRMTQIVATSIEYLFAQRQLAQISAGYMPSNQRSGNVLQRLGFETIGLERDYLQINGKLEDHIVTTKRNPYQFQFS
ncbi:GNAT family N-acetyltransferase [uncultured Ferrimonas sp.]|uniref:GNAT family N-acetyltransferase n=1 Tax=uncultured Ferrimonas sp. TaxID=432640 RepID=UPI00261C30C2|nr:GNAT family N-acetyltransferase [uncultured Ferrimonas sp.]